jgi:PKD repeat protein
VKLFSNNLNKQKMKKFLLIIGMMIWVNLMFAQTATIDLGEVYNPSAGFVYVPLTITQIANPNGTTVSGYALYFTYNASVCGNTLAYTDDPFWGSNGFTFVKNVTQNSPIPGWNTVNIVAASGDFCEVTAPQLITTIRFTYVAGGTPLDWTTAFLKGEGDDVKTLSYMVDYDGIGYGLTTLPGFIGTAVTAPVADFVGAPLTGVAPLTVNFTDLSTNTPTSWAWDFGDLGTSTLQNPSHVYAAGTWTVSLTAANAGGSDIETKVGYIVVTSPCTPGLWSGNGIPGAWDDPNNWDCLAVPGPGADIIIGEVTKAAPPVLTFGPIVIGSLTIMPGGLLTIASGGELTALGNTTIMTGTTNGKLYITSDATGWSGSFIDNGTIVGGGDFQFDREIVCTGTLAGTGNPFGWSYLSSPVSTFTTDDLPNYFVNSWDQGNGVWNQMGYGLSSPCTPWPTTVLGDMDAWSINEDLMYPYPACPGSPLTTAETIEFKSTTAGVHTNVPGKTLGYGAGLYQDWNLVANPYPSGVEPNLLTFGPNTYPATYFYFACDGNYYYWSSAVGPYGMPANNGFFVRTTGPGDVLSIPNTARTHPTDWFWKSEVTSLLTLQASGNDLTDKLYVRFMEDAVAGLGKDGDAFKLFSETEGIPQIYTMAGSEMLAINALPETPAVPMGFRANGSGTYTIEAIETSEFENVVLEDLFTGVETDLLTGSYTFDYNVGDNDSRFVIHFTPLGTPELSANSISIWAANQMIYVQAPATTGDIVVYNMMGQEVVRTAIVPGLNEIPMKDINTYYIVKVLGSDVTETGKVFIK